MFQCDVLFCVRVTAKSSVRHVDLSLSRFGSFNSDFDTATGLKRDWWRAEQGLTGRILKDTI